MDHLAPIVFEVEEDGLERLRHLMRFVRGDKRLPIHTNLDGEVLAVAEPGALIINTTSLDTYRKRVTRFLLERRTHLTIHKLRTNQPIGAGELPALDNLLFEQGEGSHRASSCAPSSASTPGLHASPSAHSSTPGKSA